MLITIKGFRCYKDNQFLITDGQITLLSGPSGIDKSTIMQAIYWCLYGNLRNIYPRQVDPKQKKDKCIVEIQLSEMTIKRQSNPNILVVITPDDKNHVDAVGQAVIDQFFGHRELWKTCCYIDQGNRCTLLSGSNKDKMSILNSIAFLYDDPKSCIKKIDDKLKEYTIEVRMLQVRYETSIKNFSDRLKIRPVAKSDILSFEQKQELQENIVNFVNKRQKITELLSTYNNFIGQKHSFESNVNKSRKEIFDMESKHENLDITQKITELKIKKSQLQEIVDKLKLECNSFEQWTKTQGIISGIDSQNSSILSKLSPKFNEVSLQSLRKSLGENPELIEKSREKQQLYLSYQQTGKIFLINVGNFAKIVSDHPHLKSLIFWNESSDLLKDVKQLHQFSVMITGLKNEITMILNHIGNFSKIRSIDEKIFQLCIQLQNSIDEGAILNNKEDHINVPFENFTNIDVDNIADYYEKTYILRYFLFSKIISKEKLRDLKSNFENSKNSLNILKCPYCENSLRINDNSLIKADEEPVTAEDIHQQHKIFMNKYQQWQIKDQIKQLLSEKFVILENFILEDDKNSVGTTVDLLFLYKNFSKPIAMKFLTMFQKFLQLNRKYSKIDVNGLNTLLQGSFNDLNFLIDIVTKLQKMSTENVHNYEDLELSLQYFKNLDYKIQILGSLNNTVDFTRFDVDDHHAKLTLIPMKLNTNVATNFFMFLVF